VFAAALPVEKEPTKCSIFIKDSIITKNQNHAQKHILSAFSLLWLTYPVVHFSNIYKNVGPLYKQKWRHVLYSLIAVSIMFCSRPMQILPVTF